MSDRHEHAIARIESKLDALIKHAGLLWREEPNPDECIGVGDMDGWWRGWSIADAASRALMSWSYRDGERVTRAELERLQDVGAAGIVTMDDVRGASIDVRDGDVTFRASLGRSWLLSAANVWPKSYETASVLVRGGYCDAAGWEKIT